MKTTVSLLAYRAKILILASMLFCIGSNVYAQAPPSNDNCTGAMVLTSAASCTNKAGTLVRATSSATGAYCGNAGSPDVWYSFTAASPYPTITLSNIGNNLNAAGPRIQLLSGTCAGLSSLGCVSGTSLNVGAVVGGAGLVVGNTYYIRIYTNTAGTWTSGSYTFNICITDPGAAVVDKGKSCVNISKGTSGGTAEPGDTLEIRVTFVVKANTAYGCSLTDNIPLNTTYLPGTLRVLTNEGKTYQQFTDAADGDAATISGSSVTINLGAGANASTGGSVSNTSKPSFYSSTCIMVASYRVVVNPSATYGTKVPVGTGILQYHNYGPGGAATSILFPEDTILVYKNYGMCSNTVGTNAIISESGGTFGSGNVKDRAASNKVPANYTYALFSSGGAMPQDYYYGVSNNTSGGTTAAAGYSTVNTWAYPDNSQNPSHRIFGVWDIIGDHTGASNPSLGNPATDDNAGTTGGYMVVINSAYRTDTAFLDTISNLCPNTYYQYSAWLRNMCPRCGCDSNGKGASSSGYIPTAPGDSSGVHPNLTFNINGYDYYTTGNMLYTGAWVQKGFTYLTGPTQTSMVINIRNNAPGGGGNDWAIDDIGVASCSPNMLLTPAKPDTLCQGADDTVRFKVTSFFNNYTEWKLEKSLDNGTTWMTTGNDTLGNPPSGSGTPVFNSVTNQYEYLVTRYFRLNAVDTYIIYRIIVASTTANLSNGNCSFATSSPKVVKAVNCMIVLPVSLVSFKGQLQNGLGQLQWTSVDETGDILYTVERSEDGLNFAAIGSVKGQALAGQGASYQFIDPRLITGQVYYRINISSGINHQYSNQVLLSNSAIDFGLKSLVNPFFDHISFDMTIPGNGTALISLVDMYGRMVRQTRQSVNQGLKSIALYDLGNLSVGTYVLQVQYGDKIISKKLVKLSK